MSIHSVQISKPIDTLLISIDYFPQVSTAVNLFYIFNKAVIIPNLDRRSIQESPYYSFLSQRSYIRCFVALIPVAGNIFLAMYDYAQRQYVNKEALIPKLKSGQTLLYHFAPKELKCDRDVMLAAAEGGAVFPTQDREILLKQVKNGSSWYFHEKFADDEEIFIEDIKAGGSKIKHASALVRSSEKIAEAVINSHDITLFYYLSPIIKKNINYVLPAVSKKGDLLSALSDSLKRNEEVVRAAVENNGDALKYASESLRNNKELLLAALRTRKSPILYTSERLQNDDDVIKALLSDGIFISPEERIQVQELNPKIARAFRG